MNELVEFLKTDEVCIVFTIAIVICIFGTLYFLLEKNYHNRKKKRNTKELNDLVEQLEMDKKEEYVIQTPVIEQIIETSKITSEDKKEEFLNLEETKKESPLVIPIEEFQKGYTENIKSDDKEVLAESIKPSDSITTIYEQVKDEIETLESIGVKEEELQYTDAVPNPEEARNELRKATAELLKAQENENKQNIELTEFEEEQEKNAIISVDELMKKSDFWYEQNEVMQYEDEGNEPISIQDLEKRMNAIREEAMSLENDKEKPISDIVDIKENLDFRVEKDVPKVSMDDFYTIDSSKAYQENHVFKSSPIISPIFGIEKQPAIENNLELENTANYEKFDEEIKKTNEFLATLRELQKKLD